MSAVRIRSKAESSKRRQVVIYMPVDVENDSIHVRVRRQIKRIIDEYVTTYKKPIRRKKLQELVITTDPKIWKLYEERKETAIAVFSFELSRLVKEGSVVRVKDPLKPRRTYYVLPEHLEALKGLS
ncbi:MAG: hypothetical protein NO114_05100 [Sulfolobales archaeon]|nr:hypothetical protein [Sulfolobales archaeon]